MDNTLQSPAVGIMINKNYSNATAYTIACDCHSDDHQVHMWIEIDSESHCKDVSLTFYVNTTTPFWKEGFSRVKAAWDILVKGYREDHHTLLLNHDAALNVANAIKENVDKLDKLSK